MRTISLLALCLPAFAAAQDDQDPPLLRDLSVLQLKVTGIAAVESLSIFDIGRQAVIAPSEKQQLLVVTLEGRAERPWRVPMTTDDFSALYEVPGGPADGEGVRPEICRSVGFAWDDITDGTRWLLKPEKGNRMTVHHLGGPAPVVLRVGFLISSEAESFTVRLPASAGAINVPEN